MSNERRIEIALYALIVVAVAIAVAQSWNRWLDPIIDAGRDLYIAEQLHHGTKLYTDFRYNYPPLAPYLLAGITAVTGNELPSYATIGLISGLLIAATLAFFLRAAVSRIAGLAAALLFVACYLCGASTFGSNYLFPYSYAATFGMLFFLLFAALLYRAVFTPDGPRWMLVAALICGLAAAWSRIEFAACAAALVLFVAVVHRAHLAWLWFVAMGVSIAIAVAYFGPALRDNTLSSSLLGGSSARLFYRHVTGMDDWQRKLALRAIAAVIVACGVAMIALLERVQKQRTAVTVIVLAFGVATVLMTGNLFFQAWSVLQIVLLPFALRRPREPLLFLLLMSMTTSSRIFFNLSPDWYGFVFSLPAVVLILYTLFAWLPARGVYSRGLALSWLPLVILIAGRWLFEQNEAYVYKRFLINTPRGSFYDADADRARAINEALPQLRDAKSLAVFPEGLSLNYFARVPTTLTYHTFIPPETADPSVEARILTELQQRPPDYAIVVSRAVGEFGYRAFAVDYDQRIGEHLRQSYTPIAQWRGPSFRMQLSRRNP
ncbi:MAG: hypothetical protein JOZ54_24315 [Acidobacteria bacterium]|nr:hypothetical protein [Acidobacteriota bacterium]